MFSPVLQWSMKLQEPQAKPGEGVRPARSPDSQGFSYSPLFIHPGCNKFRLQGIAGQGEIRAWWGGAPSSALPTKHSTAQEVWSHLDSPWNTQVVARPLCFLHGGAWWLWLSPCTLSKHIGAPKPRASCLPSPARTDFRRAKRSNWLFKCTF